VNAGSERRVGVEPTRVHPGFVVPDPRAAADFFERHFGFRRTVDRPEYVQVRHAGLSAEIGFALAGWLASPSAFRPEFDGNGAWITVEVADVEASLADFVRIDYALVEPLTDRSFGERHFVVRAPGGMLVNVVQAKSSASDETREKGNR
jgi:catechol 2,3-dioxygenase-like lactoylglutathione lyase family enzyme